MYADDLLLISLTVTDLQKLIGICQESLKTLDLEINYSKSSCLRIGPRYNVKAADLYCNDNKLNWVSCIQFLGIHITSGKSFVSNWQHARSNFYKATNGILSKLGSNPPLNIALKLVISNCAPMLLYGTAASPARASELKKSSFAFNSVFYKLFGTKSENEILFTQYMCNLLGFSHQQNYLRITFLLNLVRKGIIKPQTAFDEDDFKELGPFMNKYNFNQDSSKNFIKK